MGNGITTKTSDPVRFVKAIKRGFPGVELIKDPKSSTATVKGTYWTLFVEELASNETLYTLYFTGVQVSVHDLCISLSTNCWLRTLVLSGNEIALGKDIGEMLKSNQSLQVLRIINNKMADDGFSDIAEGLEVNRTLQHLDLKQNNIADVGATRMAKTLEFNHVLKVLRLDSNYIGARGALSLSDCLKHNPALLRLILDWEKIPTTTVKKIKARTRENRERFKAAAIAERKRKLREPPAGATTTPARSRPALPERRPMYAALGVGRSSFSVVKAPSETFAEKPHRDPFPFISNLPDLPKPYQFYFFPSHNWGKEQVVHKRVKQLVDAFEAHGKPAWFDAERLTGNISFQITEGVDQSLIFLAFITRDYVEKVVAGAKSNIATDWCQYEFNYAETRLPGRIFPVVLEPEMLSSNNWVGPVGARLGNKMFIDFTSDDKLKSCLLEVSKIIQQEQYKILELNRQLQEEALQRKLELERREAEEKKRLAEEQLRLKKELEKRAAEERKKTEEVQLQQKREAAEERKLAQQARKRADEEQLQQKRDKAKEERERKPVVS